MKTVIQVVKNSSVIVEKNIVGQIDFGLLVLFGAEDSDTMEQVEKLATKIVKLRIFKDENDKVNKSVQDVGGQVLVVSNFTLLASCEGANRPSFSRAGNPTYANELYEHLITCLKKQIPCQSGQFGAHMEIEQTLIGPMTILL